MRAWVNTRHARITFIGVSFRTTSFISAPNFVKAITLGARRRDYLRADWMAPRHVTQRRPTGVSLPTAAGRRINACFHPQQ